jgi:hypothetical protein
MEFKEFLFLIYQIMPFIIVAFLIISSLFSGELSAFLVLVGIILSSFITIGISKLLGGGQTNEVLNKCEILIFNNSPLTNLPLSTHTFAFIFGYFIYVIVTNNLVYQNGLLIAMVTLLVGIDILYKFNSDCVQNFTIPLLIGIFSGVIWAVMIGKKNQMIPQEDPASKCSVTKGLYKCKIKRTGQIIAG